MRDPCTTGRTESDHTTKLEVIVPDDPPEITPDVALALLKMLTNVHAARNDQPRFADHDERRRSA
jgi:hypothetical protein